MSPGESVVDAGRQPRGWPLRPRDVVASIVTLMTLAVAQPLLDLIGRNAAFLVAHDARGFEVVGVALGLTLVLPLVLGGAVVLLRRLSAAAAAVMHAVILAVLAAVLMLVVLQLSGVAGSMQAPAAVTVAALFGAAAAAVYRVSSTTRRVLVVAAVAAPVVAGLFLFATPAKTLVLSSSGASVSADLGDNPPPVVMVIFDELPLASLLDAQHTVDERAFPAFARLEGDATWLRNTTTVHGQTSEAVPAALGGRYPRSGALPVAADHPNNLFSLLAPTHGMHVVEPLTELCPPTVCPRPTAGKADRIGTLVRDLAVVGGHLVLPPDYARGLPPIDQGWKDFRQTAKEQGKEIVFRDRFRAIRAQNPMYGADAFINEIRAAQRPALHFLHVLLPHSPWRYAADGREYDQSVELPGLAYGRWSDDEWRVAQGYQRHLVQLQLADAVLGRLLDRLASEGLYRKSLVVVMADHGASLTPGTSLRAVEPRTFPEIGAVPFFVKPPQQSTGGVSDAPVEIIDVLPTILDALGGNPPPGIDGRSALGDAQPRASKRFYGPAGVLTFDTSLQPVYDVAARKHALFSTATDMPFPYGLTPPGMEWVLGPDAAPDGRALPGVSSSVEELARFDDVDLSAPTVPALVTGAISGETAAVRGVAVAVNGRIQAVTLPEEAGPSSRRFQALIPPASLREGANDIELFAVHGQRRLTPLTLQSGALVPDE